MFVEKPLPVDKEIEYPICIEDGPLQRIEDVKENKFYYYRIRNNPRVIFVTKLDLSKWRCYGRYILKDGGWSAPTIFTIDGFIYGKTTSLLHLPPFLLEEEWATDVSKKKYYEELRLAKQNRR